MEGTKTAAEQISMSKTCQLQLLKQSSMYNECHGERSLDTSCKQSKISHGCVLGVAIAQHAFQISLAPDAPVAAHEP